MGGAKRIVVIGSGPGGAGAAALLAVRGHEVTLLERNGFYGAKCWSFEKDGFMVDSGVHMFSMGAGGPHGELNRMVAGDLEWLASNPMSDIISGGTVHMNAYRNQFDPRGVYWNVKAMAQGKLADRRRERSGSGGRKLLERETYQASRKYGPAEALGVAARIARLDPTALCELDEITLQEFAHRISDDHGFLQTLATLCMVLMVVPYSEASAGEFLWCFSNIYRSKTLGVPKGGSREVPGAFIRAFERAGGKLKLGREVERVTVRNGRATGVECKGGRTYSADVVISNAGIKRTVELAGEKSFPAEYVDYVKGLRYSRSFITAKLGLERSVLKMPAPSFFNVPYVHADHMFDYIDEGGVPADPLLFVPMPSEWDRYAAPPGKQLLIMGVPGPIEVTPENVEQCERIIDRAEERLFEILPGVPGHVEWKMRTHIAHTAAITGKPTGECIGLGQCVGQTGIHKPSPATPVEGLWLVGADAGGRGVGTEQASASAIYVAGLVG